MIEEQEVVRVARARSSEMIASAEAKSKELRRVASEYVDDLMRQTELSMSQALETIRTAHSSFQSLGGGVAPQPQQAPRQEPPKAQPRQEQPKTQPEQAKAQPRQTPPRQAQMPQGTPDPISSKIQRIQRTEES